MERAVIIGIYNDLGFQLCKKVLEDGIEVDAVHLDGEINTRSEERRLEIGRNANFGEWNFEEYHLPSLNRQGTFLFLDYSDVMIGNCRPSAELVNKLKNIISELPGNEGKVVLFLPLALYRKEKEKADFQEVLSFIKEKQIGLQLFYIPYFDDTSKSSMTKEDDRERNDGDPDAIIQAVLEIVTE